MRGAYMFPFGWWTPYAQDWNSIPYLPVYFHVITKLNLITSHSLLTSFSLAYQKIIYLYLWRHSPGVGWAGLGVFVRARKRLSPNPFFSVRNRRLAVPGLSNDKSLTWTQIKQRSRSRGTNISYSLCTWTDCTLRAFLSSLNPTQRALCTLKNLGRFLTCTRVLKGKSLFPIKKASKHLRKHRSMLALFFFPSTRIRIG